MKRVCEPCSPVREREREREREKEGGREREKKRGRERERERGREREKEGERGKERERGREGGREGERKSRKCRPSLSIPHSVCQSVSMPDYYINFWYESTVTLWYIGSLSDR